MPRHDYKCPQCGHVAEDVWVSNWRSIAGHEMPRPCPECEKTMERQPAAPNFSVKGYSARNNYGVKND